jgi:hypothetical protein
MAEGIKIGNQLATSPTVENQHIRTGDYGQIQPEMVDFTQL